MNGVKMNGVNIDAAHLRPAELLHGQHNTHRAEFDQLYAAMARFVAKQGECTFAELYDVFGEQPDDATSRKRMHKRLHTAQLRGLVARVVVAGQALYVLPGSAVLYAQAKEPQRATAPAYDLMRAPLWVPPKTAITRPGAEDFLRCPSVGLRV